MKTQRGGTFLGLIVGIVVGLAVALSVAIYVAKVPVPFVNKGNTRTNGQDAAEAEKNKDWDPNNLLRGKGTPVSTTPTPTASGAPIAPPAEVPRNSAVDTPRPPADVTPATQAARSPSASDDPLGDFANARVRRNAAPEPAPVATAAADSLVYFVQVGAFRSSEEAEGQRARLLLAGVQAQISERDQAGRPMYRVRVGPFQNRDAAERVKTRLAGDGFDAVLAGTPR